MILTSTHRQEASDSSPKIGGALVLQHTARTFIKGRNIRLDEICRTFCSMERTAYNLLREGMDAASVKEPEGAE